MKLRIVAAVACVVVCSAVSSTLTWAQDTATRPTRPMQQGRGSMPRRPMEQQLQQRINTIVRNQLQLNDVQMGKLQDLNARNEANRVAIRDEERGVRSALRAELLAANGGNEQKIAELLDRLPQIERKRITLMESEQKELAQFLTPSQRARYFALQDELRRNLQDMQRRRMGPPPGENGPPVRQQRGIRRPPPGVDR